MRQYSRGPWITLQVINRNPRHVFALKPHYMQLGNDSVTFVAQDASANKSMYVFKGMQGTLGNAKIQLERNKDS